MIPKAEFFEWIEDYCLDKLGDEEKIQFETELMHNRELREEVKLFNELQSALVEEDVINLRAQLEEISLDKENGSFDLLEDFTDIQEINETVSPEDLINFYDSLPKVHVYHHELASNENIHQFYKEQEQAARHNGEKDAYSDSDMEDWGDFEDLEGLEEAIMEKDILNLRETLSHVAKAVKPQFSTEDIDKYVSGELNETELKEFEAEMAQNKALQHEVKLHREMADAFEEADIFNLRDQLSHIISTETSWNVSEQSIEQYIDGELDAELLEEFMSELNENTDLMAEVALRRNINEAIGEEDIYSLRDKLDSARRSSENTEIKSIVPDTSIHLFSNWKRVVAVAVILLGIAGIYNISFNSLDNTYNSFYKSPTMSVERTVTPAESVSQDELAFINKGNYYYRNEDYQKAIESYNLALSKGKAGAFVPHFYKAASLQNLKKYEEAIQEYNQVIKQGGNLFLEEAEWNKSLCYLKLDKKEKASQNLEAIVNKNGYYAKDAKDILKRLKFSIR